MSVVAHIVVVNYRTPELAERCVQSAIMTVDVPAFVHVVDTSDGPGALTDLAGTWVSYLPNVGYAQALNHGFMCPPPGIAAHVNGAPLLIACNADVEFPTDGIRDLIALFDEQPSLAILGPRQVTPDARIAHAGILGHGATDGGRDYGQPDHGQHTERILDVAQVSGSVMFIRRQAYHRLGGIPTVSRLYFEDALLCLKARRAGWVVAYSGLRTFTHHVAASPQPVDSSRVQLAVAGAQTFQDALRTQMRTA